MGAERRECLTLPGEELVPDDLTKGVIKTWGFRPGGRRSQKGHLKNVLWGILLLSAP